MKERPILFSAPMVRAMLAETKTQTRRVVKPQPDEHGLTREEQTWPNNWKWFDSGCRDHRCPYGQPGDRLWVREVWSQPTTFDPGPTFYRADYPDCVPPHFENVPTADQVKWKPSIHMRRDQSRILLEVTAVRVERLNDISEADCIAEGVPRGNHATKWPNGDPGYIDDVQRRNYCVLWEQINGPGSWAANPWVWVIEFRRTEP